MKVHNIPSLNPLQLFRSPFQPQQQQQGRGPASSGVSNSRNIPKVPSLLFEIELEEAPVRADIPDDSETQGVLTNFRSLVVPWSKTEHELLAQWIASHDSSHDHMQSLNALATRLRSLGHPVSIRTALGGGWGGECLRNLRHSFLVCTVSGKEGSGTYIIDPAFREQFSIAHPTPRYEQILSAIPAAFVGTEERLVSLVRALCHEIQGVFLEQNATLPPWRDVAAQLSKWRPRRSMDCHGQQEDSVLPVIRPSMDAVFEEEASREPAFSPYLAARSVSAGNESAKQPSRVLHLTARPASAGPLHPSESDAKPENLVRMSAAATPVGSDNISRPKPASQPSGNTKGNLYQRMAGEVQQFVTRSYNHTGMLVSGL